MVRKHPKSLLEKHKLYQRCAAVVQNPEVTAERLESTGSEWRRERKRFVSSQKAYAGTKNKKPKPIAIIGMSGRLPGSTNLEEFWKHLESNNDLITEVPKDRWDWRQYYGDPLEESGKTKVKWGGFISDVDRFDPLFFGISPREAESMDPQLRLFIETIWATIENAGYRASALSGSPTGVFVGVTTTDYKELWEQAEVEA